VEEKVVALTFDAAYDPAPLGQILEALRAGGATGTFFLTGEFVEDFPEEVRRIHAAGYPIGNHSYDHPDFRTLSREQLASQLGRTTRLLAEQGVPDPRPLFRFPFGGRDADTLAAVGAEGYDSIYWTIDTLDWRPERTPAQIRAAVLEDLRPGAIVLMHVGSGQTAEVLPSLIHDLKERGYRFITVPEGLPRE
jgi:peptidoglycan/xylan/chitin deacetylase (PgdA/CDA1 family)